MKRDKTGTFKYDWARTNHRLTVHPRELAQEILFELIGSSTAIMRYYEQHGYQVENETVEDLIVRTVQAHVIYSEDGDAFGQLKELRYNLKEIEWVQDHEGDVVCLACETLFPSEHKDNCWLKKELK